MWLREDSSLALAAPAGMEPPDVYHYDPRDPVPSNGGNNLVLPGGPRDQHDQLYRDDVLRYFSDPLPDDLVVKGRVTVRLHASSNRLDTDFTAKLVDIYNDSLERKMLVLDAILMGRHRNGLDQEDLLEPDSVYRFDIELGNTAYVFPAGHRLCLAISSSNSPRFLTNLNTGGHPYRDTLDTLVAANSVHHSHRYPSRIVFQGQGPAGVSEEPAVRLPTPGNPLHGFGVFDVSGRRIRACRTRADLANLPPGCYVVRESGATRKVVRVR
jgi:putative CocE/NonD family hydrolase